MDRIAGALFGSALGDALGAAFECVASEDIRRYLGRPIVLGFEAAMPGSLLFPRGPGRPTDDTAMTISVVRALSSGEPLTADRFARRFLADLAPGAGAVADMFWTGGPGNATLRALARLRAGAAANTCGARVDGGNGAAMRAHPIGFLADRAEVLRIASLQARVTHGHPAAVAAAQAVAVLVHDALAGAKPSAALPAGIGNVTFARAWRSAHVRPPDGDGLPAHLRDADMSGWKTVATAHAISLLYPDPLEAIGRAAASGCDTDTVAAIAGAFAGARSGIGAFPASLIDGLNDGGTVRKALSELLRSDRFAFYLKPQAADFARVPLDLRRRCAGVRANSPESGRGRRMGT
jgi:ADP-ribosylglycohydrolase